MIFCAGSIVYRSQTNKRHTCVAALRKASWPGIVDQDNSSRAAGMPKKKSTRRLPKKRIKPRIHKHGGAAKREPAAWTLDQIREGQTYRFQTMLSEADVDSFAALTGDMNYIHLKNGFARKRGFDNRLIHGAFLVGLMSRLVGMHLPGRECLLLELRVKFRAPAYAGDRLLVEGTVTQRSGSGKAIVVKIDVSVPAAKRLVATANAVVGFTAEGAS
jgi:3-hydroxybutyryl-CoA dehydratase